MMLSKRVGLPPKKRNEAGLAPHEKGRSGEMRIDEYNVPVDRRVHLPIDQMSI